MRDDGLEHQTRPRVNEMNMIIMQYLIDGGGNINSSTDEEDTVK